MGVWLIISIGFAVQLIVVLTGFTMMTRDRRTVKAVHDLIVKDIQRFL